MTEVVTKVLARVRVLSCLAAREWGWHPASPCNVYRALQLSVIRYAGAAWLPFISAIQMDRLERANNTALRAITGQLRSTPTEALHAEAGLPSIRAVSRQLVAVSMERAARLPAKHPSRLALDGTTPHRLRRPSWRSVGQSILASLPAKVSNRAPLLRWEDPRWVPTALARFELTLADGSSKREHRPASCAV